MAQKLIELFAEPRVGSGGEVSLLQLLDGGDERLGDEPPPVRAEVAAGVWIAPAEDGALSDCRFRVAQMHSVRAPEIAPPSPDS